MRQNTIEQKSFIYRIGNTFIKIIAFLIAVIYSVSQVLGTIALGAVYDFIDKQLGVPETAYTAPEEPRFAIGFLENLFDTPFFIGLNILLFFVAIVGTLILTRKRSFYAALGLFAAFILPKEEIYRGTVIDEQTKQSIAFAVIRLFEFGENQQLNYIKQTVADVDGRYSLYLSEFSESLKIEVVASGYDIVKVDAAPIPGRSGGFDISQDVILSREEKVSNKNRIIYLQSQFYKGLMWTIYIGSIFLFLIFFYYFIAYPGSLYGVISVVIFGYSSVKNTFTIRQRFLKKSGRIFDYVTKKPIEGIVLNLFDGYQKLESVTSDKNGVVKFHANAGNYQVSMATKGYSLVGVDPTGSKRVNIEKDGYLESNLFIVKLVFGTSVTNLNNNPFSD